MHKTLLNQVSPHISGVTVILWNQVHPALAGCPSSCLSAKFLVPVRSRISGAPFPTCVCEVYVPSLACQGVVCDMCTRTLNLSLLGWPKEGVANGLTYGGRTNGLDMNIVTGEPGVSS